MDSNPLLSSDQDSDSGKLVRQACQFFYRDFELRPTEEDLVDSYAALKEKIVRVIGHLLASDPQRLVNLMYRLDVDEPRFKAALAHSSRESIADRVAELVLEREKQKVFWRNKYRE